MISGKDKAAIRNAMLSKETFCNHMRCNVKLCLYAVAIANAKSFRLVRGMQSRTLMPSRYTPISLSGELGNSRIRTPVVSLAPRPPNP
jgi:hypothetical protein